MVIEKGMGEKRRGRVERCGRMGERRGGWGRPENEGRGKRQGMEEKEGKASRGGAMRWCERKSGRGRVCSQGGGGAWRCRKERIG